MTQKFTIPPEVVEAAWDGFVIRDDMEASIQAALVKWCEIGKAELLESSVITVSRTRTWPVDELPVLIIRLQGDWQ